MTKKEISKGIRCRVVNPRWSKRIAQIDKMRMHAYCDTAKWSKPLYGPDQVCVESDPAATQLVAASVGDKVVASSRLCLVNTREEFERESGVVLPFNADDFPVIVVRRACVLSPDYWDCFKALHYSCLDVAWYMMNGVKAMMGVVAEANPLSRNLAQLGSSSEVENASAGSSTFTGTHMSVTNFEFEFGEARDHVWTRYVNGKLSECRWEGSRPFQEYLPDQLTVGKWK